MRLEYKGKPKQVRELLATDEMQDPKKGLAVACNGHLVDLDAKVEEGDVIEIFDFSTPEGRQVFWHTSAHILGQALTRLYPNVQLTIGPPIEQGFYYDCANLSISEHDFEAIEKEAEKIIQERFVPKQELFASKEEALASFPLNPYKQELIRELDENSPITAYRQGEFLDLCKGPHLPSLSKVKAFKLLKVSGAYWRGDSKNSMLTRIYGISFPEKSLLKAFIERIEEAKKRDHRKIGLELDLFSFQESAPGMPFFHPMGMRLLNRILDFWRSLQLSSGYIEIKTPIILNQSLWEQSGHWANYRENMYVTEIEKGTFAIKPMNCPGCMLYYGTQQHSYRNLPLRVMEFGQVFRHEFSGALSGLFRVRSFVQDDAHIFLEEEQIQQEIIHILELAKILYETFQLRYRLELSTRPAKSIGDDASWERATLGLKGALDALKLPYKINEGDGAFYGPKIDFHIEDALGRSWQCGTIQLDMLLPMRFKLTYVDSKGETRVPVMLHRALLGSIERFMGILIEHFAGKFPLWLNPRQIVILPVSDRHQESAQLLKQHAQGLGFFVEVDDSKESISKRIRNSQALRYNYMVILGDREVETGLLSLRLRNNQVLNDISPSCFFSSLSREIEEKALDSVGFEGVS